MSTFCKCLVAIVIWASLLLGGIAASDLESSMIERYSINDQKGIAIVMKNDRMAFHCIMAAADQHNVDRIKVLKAIEERVVGTNYPGYNLRTINSEIIYDKFNY